NGALKRLEINYRPLSALSADIRPQKFETLPHSREFSRIQEAKQMHDSQVTDGTAVPILSVGIEDAPKVLGGVSRTRIFQAVQNKEIRIRKNGRLWCGGDRGGGGGQKHARTKGRPPDRGGGMGR